MGKKSSWYTSGVTIGLGVATVLVLVKGWPDRSDLVAADLLPTSRLDDTWQVPAELRYEVACNLFCIGNTTKTHEVYAQMVKEAREARGESIGMDWHLFVEDTCIEKCLLDHRKGRISLREDFSTAATLPDPIQKYFSCASGCREALAAAASAGTTVDAAASTLARCGVVHVPLGAATEKLVAELHAGLEALRKRPLGFKGLIDPNPPLRSGRQEIWLPFGEPFSRFVELLSNPAVAEIVQSFFNSSSVTVDHVNVVNAPGSNVSTRQGLHSDVGLPGEHLEVHLPLTVGDAARSGLPLSRGPTRFCPCTQGLTDLQDPYARSIRRYFGSYEHCLDHENLSWMLHSKNAKVNGPWLTIYDADLYHQGIENVSPDDRPVLVVALTTSLAAAHKRAYVKRNISAEHEDALIRYRGVELSEAFGPSAAAKA